MSTTQFDRDSMACWYAQEHFKTDPGIDTIWYLPTGAGEREIRFVVINTMTYDRTDAALEPIDFGIDRGTDSAHKLCELDVTPDQWHRVQSGKLGLPDGWSLEGAKSYPE